MVRAKTLRCERDDVLYSCSVCVGGALAAALLQADGCDNRTHIMQQTHGGGGRAAGSIPGEQGAPGWAGERGRERSRDPERAHMLQRAIQGERRGVYSTARGLICSLVGPESQAKVTVQIHPSGVWPSSPLVCALIALNGPFPAPFVVWRSLSTRPLACPVSSPSIHLLSISLYLPLSCTYIQPPASGRARRCASSLQSSYDPTTQRPRDPRPAWTPRLHATFDAPPKVLRRRPQCPDPKTPGLHSLSVSRLFLVHHTHTHSVSSILHTHTPGHTSALATTTTTISSTTTS